MRREQQAQGIGLGDFGGQSIGSGDQAIGAMLIDLEAIMPEGADQRRRVESSAGRHQDQPHRDGLPTDSSF